MILEGGSGADPDGNGTDPHDGGVPARPEPEPLDGQGGDRGHACSRPSGRARSIWLPYGMLGDLAQRARRRRWRCGSVQGRVIAQTRSPTHAEEQERLAASLGCAALLNRRTGATPLDVVEFPTLPRGYRSPGLPPASFTYLNSSPSLATAWSFP